MKKIRVIILRNELEDDHKFWVRACKEYKNRLDYRIVNLMASDWLEETQKEPFDFLLAKPGGLTAPYKQLYDERVFILAFSLGYKIFPSPLEIFIYENKRFLSYWLKANNIPNPSTEVFYDRQAALKYSEGCKYPFVAKTNIGASGTGVIIIKNKIDARAYIKKTFSGKGSPQRIGPNIEKGGVMKRGFHYILHPSNIAKKLAIYLIKSENLQKGYVFFQEFIPHEFEWRVVRIGSSFFAHKKIKLGDKSSGSLLKNYDNPPLDLLDFVKEITDRHDFFSQAVDIFESERGYLINEMQCIFGQSDRYQMFVDGIPGRYQHIDNQWSFESGDFNSNESFNLRVEHVLNLYNSK